MALGVTTIRLVSVMVRLQQTDFSLWKNLLLHHFTFYGVSKQERRNYIIMTNNNGT